MAINTYAALSPDILLNPSPGCINLSGLKTLNSIISEIFANGEQGFTRTPGDLSTMFQDAAGTIPVTGAGQPVGLMLDKGNGLILGNDLITNGDFSNGSTMWQSVDGPGKPTNTHMSVTNGVMTCTGVDSVRLCQSRQLTQGKWYKLSCDVISSNVAIVLTAAQGEDLTNMVVSNTFSLGNGKRTTYFYSNYSSLFIGIRAGGAGSFSIDNITLQEIKGNHAYQATSAFRPILQNAPRRIDFDAVDDKLITNLPAQLTGCTVVRAVPNVGTQILTGQTIPATYEDNTDHCGLIVINRALTATETSQITKLFNKAAGV